MSEPLGERTVPYVLEICTARVAIGLVEAYVPPTACSDLRARGRLRDPDVLLPPLTGKEHGLGLRHSHHFAAS
jgi:hypothetical protein